MGKIFHHDSPLPDGDERQTPRKLFDYLDSIYQFNLDAAATRENALCADFLTKEDNSLVHPWGGKRVWCNPPFTQKTAFLQKALTEARFYNTLVVMLLPTSTGTYWWRDYVMQANEILCHRGRLKFAPFKESAPFDVALAVFLPNTCPLWPTIKMLEPLPEYHIYQPSTGEDKWT